MHTWTITLVLRRELRRRAVALAGLALTVALGGGVTIGSLVAAHRTDRAYPDYVRRAQVPELVINPSLITKAADAAMRRLPGTTNVHSDALLQASVTRTRPAPLREILSTDPSLQVRGSTDGRYEAIDRPVLTEGRFARGDHEVFVTDDYRRDLEAAVGRRLRVGDTIKMAFWWGLLADAGLPLNKVVKPIGVESLRVAGFGRLSDEILPDELYPRQRLVVSADVAARYTCLADLRADMTKQEAEEAGFPQDCASQYRYYAMQLRHDRGAKAAVRRAFNSETKRLTPQIPRSLRDLGVSYYYVSQERSDVDHAVRQVTRPTVAALIVFGLAAGAATLTVVALAISRILRRNETAQQILHAMGATRLERTVIGAGPSLVATAIGLVAAVPVAFVTSLVGPLGSVRAVISSPSFGLPGRVVWPAVVLIGLALVAITGVLAWSAAARASRPPERRERRTRVSGRLVRSGRPATAHGVRAAISTRRSDGGTAVLAGCVVAVASLGAALVFGTNLTALVREPSRYGWPWDVAVINGGGYGDTNPRQVAASLNGNPAVEDHGLFAFDSSTTVAGKPVPAIYGFRSNGGMQLPLVKGRNPSRPGEAVIGSTTAHELNVSLGDRVRIESPVGLRAVKVVGMAVLPSLGPFIAARTGPGTGVAVLVDLDPADPHNQYPASLTAIHLRSGTDAKAFLRGLKPRFQRWDVNGAPPTATLASPVRPPEIVNADSMRVAPLVLGGLLGLGLMIGLALSIGVSVRDRRRELAILRALGFSRRDLRATVAWQALATITVGLVVGLPLGVVAGRLAWKTFSGQLGVSPRADIPLVWLVVVLFAAVVLALLAAAPPARAAARVAPNDVLHDVQ